MKCNSIMCLRFDITCFMRFMYLCIYLFIFYMTRIWLILVILSLSYAPQVPSYNKNTSGKRTLCYLKALSNRGKIEYVQTCMWDLEFATYTGPYPRLTMFSSIWETSCQITIYYKYLDNIEWHISQQNNIWFGKQTMAKDFKQGQILLIYWLSWTSMWRRGPTNVNGRFALLLYMQVEMWLSLHLSTLSVKT